jgi:aspartyl-tRNA synthetase
MLRTHTCGELTEQAIGQEATLCGWVATRRDHGGLIFIDLRDRYGLTQLVFNPGISVELHKEAEKLRSEFVIQVTGKVEHRPGGTENLKLKTGQIEVVVEKLAILNSCPTPPFEIENDTQVQEELRLKYRFLDIRRPVVLDRLYFRYRVTQIVREYLHENSFMEVETPFLTRSTPEGARDFLVPSRLVPGSFYALPQSPQLFKQLLMVAGVDRYFQLARCFRDEDLRADRQLEHTQIDMEMSFITEDDIMNMIEGMVVQVFQKMFQTELPRPFLRLPYEEAMNRYGSDKPDLRVKGLEFQDVSILADRSEFKVFKETIAKGGCVKGVLVPGGAQFSRKDIEDMTAFLSDFKAKGLAWLKFTEAGWESPIKKFFSDEILKEFHSLFKPEKGSIVFFVADEWSVVCTALGALRNLVAKKLNLVEKAFRFAWVVHFPLLQWNEEEKRFEPCHHPFTSPVLEDLQHLEKDPAKIRARAYDLVLNGVEVGGGSIRIHDEPTQERVFKAIGLTKEQAQEKFSFLLKALKYGAPPHGGIALGLDRFCAMLLGLDSIREVIAFPKTQKGFCPLTEAPAHVEPKQLKELHIGIKT